MFSIVDNSFVFNAHLCDTLYIADLVAAVKKAAADGASLDEMKKAIGDQLASKYEQGMSKYPQGRYRDRVGQNVEMVYQKVVKKG